MAAIPKCVSTNAARLLGAATPLSARTPTPANTARSWRPNPAELRNLPPLISQPASSSLPLWSATRCHTSSPVWSPPPSRRSSAFQTHGSPLCRDNPPPASLPEMPCPQFLFRPHRTPAAVAPRPLHPSAATSSDSLPAPVQNLF